MKDLAKEIEKAIKAKMDKFNKLPLDKQFPKEFLRKNHFNGDIYKVFELANVDINSINDLSKEDEGKLVNVLKPRFKSWKDFINAAVQYYLDRS